MYIKQNFTKQPHATNHTLHSTHLLLQSLDDVMQQGHVFVCAGLCIDDPVQTAELEAVSISSVSTVHDIPERQHHLQYFLQFVAGFEFVAGKEDVLDLWPCFGESLVACLDEVKGSQPLDVPRNAGRSQLQ